MKTTHLCCLKSRSKNVWKFFHTLEKNYCCVNFCLIKFYLSDVWVISGDFENDNCCFDLSCRSKHSLKACFSLPLEIKEKDPKAIAFLTTLHFNYSLMIIIAVKYTLSNLQSQISLKKWAMLPSFSLWS